VEPQRRIARRLLRLESPRSHSGAAQPQVGFLIWNVKEPDRPQLLRRWISGGTSTHRNFYVGGRWVHGTSTLRRFEGHILAIVDIEDPTNPKVTGKWWHPGQNKAGRESYTAEEERRLTSGHPFTGEFLPKERSEQRTCNQ
jgi:hypothetical protein